MLSYALETQRGHLPQVTRFLPYDPGAYMQLDDVSLATLEVFESPRWATPRAPFFVC